jgi:hypothetical protein
MKKWIAILIAASVLCCVCICAFSSNEKDDELLSAIKQDLVGPYFKAVFDNEYSPVDNKYVITFTEEKIKYEVTFPDSNDRPYSYTEEFSYKLIMKKGEPYIKVNTHRFEDMVVVLLSEGLHDEHHLVSYLDGVGADNLTYRRVR